jgi:hypothetical protein
LELEIKRIFLKDISLASFKLAAVIPVNRRALFYLAAIATIN